jgi:hypothetical protein
MIPLYALQAAGGQVLHLDDASVVKDGADSTGTGGTAFVPYYVTTGLRHPFTKGWSRLRRVLLHFAHEGSCTLTFGAYRDGRAGPTVPRAFLVGEAGIASIPFSDAASGFQLKVQISAYSAPVAISDADAFVLLHRRYR